MQARAEDPMYLRWCAEKAAIHERHYYAQGGLIERVNMVPHRLAEQPFSERDYYPSVLEVGGGFAVHPAHVRHRYDRYVVSDIDETILERAKQLHPHLEFQQADARALPFPDNSFDRLISLANLEHITDPHVALDEWKRVVRPGGAVSIVIPTEGGILWNAGRYLTTRRALAKDGLDLDYIIAREHVNACYRLVALIRHAFKDRCETWWPLRIPTPHFNLLYCCTVTV